MRMRKSRFVFANRLSTKKLNVEKISSMLSFIKSVVYVTRSLKKIRSIPVSAETKKKIEKACYQVFCFTPKSKKSGDIDLAGYKVRYCHFGSFEYVFNELFVQNEYQLNVSTDSPVILDCGSNIGLTSIYFQLLWPSAKITAFEPDQQAFECLKENVEVNKLNNITIHNIALAGKEGELKFYSEQNVSGSLTSSLSQSSGSVEVVVKADKLSNYIDSKIDILKIDIEGAEDEVMEELRQTGKLANIEQIMMEYHHHMDGNTDKLSTMLGLLEQQGFGYQIEGAMIRPPELGSPQNLIIYAYNKSLIASRQNKD